MTVDDERSAGGDRHGLPGRPVVALVSGWLIFGKVLGPVDMLGFALVLGGLAIASFVPGWAMVADTARS